MLACLAASMVLSPPVFGAPPPAQAKPDYDRTRFALIIGVSRYADQSANLLADLRGPSNDARRLSEALINKGRFDPKHVVVITEGTPLAPTRDVILDQLSRVTDQVKDTKDAFLIFYFAGHGISSEGEAYLLPSNVIAVDRPDSPIFRSTAISVSLVRKTIEDSKAEHVVLMLDACRDNPASPVPRARGAAPAQNTEAFRGAFNWKNSVTIFATQPGKEAFESGREPSVGYFADALARALMGNDPRAINGAGEVTVGTLMDYLPEEVDQRVRQDLPGRSQRPQLLVDTGAKIVLSYPGLAKIAIGAVAEPSPGDASALSPAPAPPAHLRFRLPTQALVRAGLVVTRNYFSVDPSTLTDPMAVAPGKQFLEVKLPGYRDWSREIEVRSGSTDVDVRLEPQRKYLVASLATAGVGVGALVAGAVWGARAASLAREVSACASPCIWQPVNGKEQEGMRDATLSKVFFVSGGLLLAAGSAAAAYIYWGRPTLAPDPVPPGLAFTPQRGGGSLSVARTW
jgi:hypothetical protein